MSERTTPETNALYAQLLAENPGYFIHLEEFLELARRLERERDEAREKLNEEMKWHHQTHKELVEAQCKLLDIEYDQLKS